MEQNIKSIGIIMFGLLGDVIIRTPVVRALKEIYPDAAITVIVDPIGKQVLEHNQYVDRIIVVDRKKEPNKIKQNLKKMKIIFQVRREKFDLLVNLYNAGISRPIVICSAAKYKLGFCLKENRIIYNVKYKCNPQRMIERQSLYNYMISILEPLSDKKFSLKPIFDVPSESLSTMRQYIKELPYHNDKIYVLNLGASKEDKILENEKYFYIIKYIYEKYGFTPLIVANPGQKYLQNNLIDNYLKGSNIPYVKLKVLKLQEVAALIKLTKFIITPDTGLMHLAMCFDNFIMTIFTYTHPLFVDPNNGKFIPIYEGFDTNKLYQHQNISQDKFSKAIDVLFERLSD